MQRSTADTAVPHWFVLQNSDSMSTKKPTNESLIRQLTETLAFLAIAVCIFRSFIAEGYMITTGSMAPTLWGYHKRIVCPNCNTLFSLGVTQNGSPDNEAARCPVCTAYPIDVTKLKPIEGDQILVHKHAYEVRSPRRFEVVVFRHPEDFSQAYVKRVLGLPGETVELKGGNVYIDGELARKPRDINQASRILIDDQSLDVTDDDPDWRRRWVSVTPELASFDEGNHTWKLHSESPTSPATISFRNWQRRQMMTTTSVPLSSWPEKLLAAESYHLPLTYDLKNSALKCRGSLPFSAADDMISAAKAEQIDPAFETAVKELFRLSHVTPITDTYSYNRQEYNLQPYEVQDVTLATTIDPTSATGLITLHLENAAVTTTMTIDLARKSATVRVDSQTSTEKTFAVSGRIRLELALVDGRATLAINEDVVSAISYDPEFERSRASSPGNPDAGSVHMEISVAGGKIEIPSLKVYRDIYYRHQTASRTQQNSPQRAWKLEPDELFLSGDNSPISLDSRTWKPGTIHTSYLIGKPLFLHLPSRPGVIKFAGKEFTIRLPDIPRMKSIH
jgi:signal peptidase I